MDILGLTRWPNRGRVSRSRIRSARATTVKRGAWVMLGCHVAGCRTERELGVEARGPAIVAAAALVAVRAAEDGHVILRQIHPRVIPGVAVAAISRLHRDERGLRGVARGMLEERTGRRRMVLASDEGREG